MAEAATSMHWFLLLVASSMGDEDDLQLRPRAAPLTHPPTCDVFLAPSTIPGSACMNTQQKNCAILRAVWAAILQVLYLALLGRIGDIGLQLCTAYLNIALIYSLSIVLRHQIYTLLPNSWFRSFCRTRFQQR